MVMPLGYGGGFGFGGIGGGYGYGYGPGYNPSTATGMAPQAVPIGPELSTPITPLESQSGKLNIAEKSKTGAALGALSGAAAGVATGAFFGPIGIAVGAIAGLFGGGIAGSQISKLIAVNSDANGNGKLDGNAAALVH